MSRVHLVLAAAALAAPGIIFAAERPAPARLDATGAAVKRGVDAWQAGDYATAVTAWRAPANGGDADAQFNLAQAYKLGRGVPADMREAEGWYRKAAVQGHEQAAATLGLVMFQNGDRAGAMPWLLQAAERGEPRAQYVYGTALFNGDTVAKDWPRAYAMMTRAAASGLPQAKASLAQMDQFVPMAQRQQGTALAAASATRPAAPPAAAAYRPTAATVAVPPPPAARPAPAARAPETTNATQPSPARTAPPPAPRPVAAPKPAPEPKPVPETKPAASAKAAAPAAGGAWRIQLGAFGTPAGAESAWKSLGGKSGLRGLSPAYVKAGAVTRLQAGPFASKADAAAACRSAGTTCFPVPR